MILRIVYILIVFFSWGAAHAAMTVYPMEASIGRGGVSQVRVISQGDKVQFIKINVKKIINPGTKLEHEISVGMDDTADLIVTPSKIALSAGSERVVRLISLTPPEKETTWRAYFEGVRGEDFIDYPDGNNKSNASIGVNIVWGALIHVMPKKIVPSIKIRRLNEGRIVNDGTIRIPIKEIGVCDKNGECKWKKMTVIVYPDMELDIKKFNFVTGVKYRVKYLNWISKKIEEIPLSVCG